MNIITNIILSISISTNAVSTNALSSITTIEEARDAIIKVDKIHVKNTSILDMWHHDMVSMLLSHMATITEKKQKEAKLQRNETKLLMKKKLDKSDS